MFYYDNVLTPGFTWTDWGWDRVRSRPSDDERRAAGAERLVRELGDNNGTEATTEAIIETITEAIIGEVEEEETTDATEQGENPVHREPVTTGNSIFYGIKGLYFNLLLVHQHSVDFSKSNIAIFCHIVTRKFVKVRTCEKSASGVLIMAMSVLTEQELISKLNIRNGNDMQYDV